jgi:hypothetical protein
MTAGELVGLLTIEQKNSLIGIQYQPDVYYNPIQDYDSNCVISLTEINETVNPDYLWIKNIPLIDYKPIPVPVTGTTL